MMASRGLRREVNVLACSFMLRLVIASIVRPTEGAAVASNESTSVFPPEREPKFLEFQEVATNEVEVDLEALEKVEKVEKVGDKESVEGETLSGFYTECLFHLSVPCVQKKMIACLNRLDQKDSFSVIGDVVRVVKVAGDRAWSSPLPSIVNASEEGMSVLDLVPALDAALDQDLERFFKTHVIRLTLPTWSSVAVAGSRGTLQESHRVDISIANPVDEGRGKKKGGGKLAAMKAAGMMVKMMMVGKGMMIPIMMGMTKLMGMKGIMMGGMSMLLMKMMLLMKLKSGGGMGGMMMKMMFGGGGGGGGYGGGYGGGGGGGD